MGHRRANVGNPAPSPKAENHQNFKNTQQAIERRKKLKERKKESEYEFLEVLGYVLMDDNVV